MGDSEAVMRPILKSLRAGSLSTFQPPDPVRRGEVAGPAFLTTGLHLFSPFPKVKLCPERAWGQPCINIQKYVGFLNRATQKALIGHVGQL